MEIGWSCLSKGPQGQCGTQVWMVSPCGAFTTEGEQKER